jgi:hypothetical protein
MAVAVLPAGRIITSGNGGRLLVWNPARADTDPIELGRDTYGVGAIAVLPDDRIITGGSDGFGGGSGGRVLVWDPARAGTNPTQLGRTEYRVGAVAVLPDGRIVVGTAGWFRIFMPSQWGFVITSTVACGAIDVVPAGGTGDVDLVVLHQGRRAWSGWALPPSLTPRQG